MAGIVEIVNRALSKLGDMRISSLDDNTKSAAVAASMYESVKDAEISTHSWNFAKARAKLPAEAEKPVFGWNWQYLLPADCLRVLEAGPWPRAFTGFYAGCDSRGFVLEGQRLLTNMSPPLEVIYLKKVSDPGLFPPIFVEVLASKMAVEMSESLIGLNSKKELAWKEYERALRLAKRINATGLPPVMVQDDSWVLAHQMGAL